MDNFIKEIKKLLHNGSDTINKEIAEPDNNKALDKLFDIAAVGVDTFNNNSSYSVKLHRLHADLMPLFFNFQSECNGFVIKTEKRFIFVMQSELNKIFIYGLTTKDGASARQSMTRAVQLFNLDYKKSNDEIKYYDSTNREIQPEEVVLQLFKWGLN